MKITPIVLLASLAANAVLLGVYLFRPAEPVKPSASVAARPAPTTGAPGTSKDEALRSALAAGDAAALTSAGVPADVARDLALGRTLSRIVERTRATPPKGAADGRWWRNRSTPPASREQQLVARREFSDALTSAFGADAASFTGGDGGIDFLSPEKRAALRRITQDYDEMMAGVSTGGIQLASDREKLRLLKAERDRDISSLLTAEERLAYDLHTSPAAAMVRNRYGEGLETEDDFRRIYALQKAFDDRFPLDAMTGRVTPETMRQRSDAQRQLQDDIRAALGEDKYAALRRATDSDLRNIDSLVTRLNLPPATTNQVATARENFAAESQRIQGNTALNAQERRTQIQDLATRAKNDLARVLGAEAAEAYAPRSPWVSMLQGGMAYSTSPQPNSPGVMMPGQSVYPVMPAGAGTATTGRVVLSSSVNAGYAPTHDFFIATPGGGDARQNVQVMTFATGAGDPAAGGATGERRVVMPQPAPAPTPAPKQ